MTPAALVEAFAQLVAAAVVKELRPQQPKEDLLVEEAAHELRRAPKTIRAWIADGYLPARKERGRLVISRADLDMHREARTAAGKAPRRGSKSKKAA